MQIEGDFTTAKALPQLIDSLCQTKRTGILRLSGNNHRIKIFLKNGDAVYASGPQSQAELGRMLAQRGLVSMDKLKAAAMHAKQRRIILGQALVDNDFITPQALHAEIRQLTQKTLSSLLGWENGHFEYEDAPVSLEKLYPDRNKRTAGDIKTRIANSVRVIPPMPEVIQKARQAMADQESTFRDLAKILEKDQGIAARILRLANSPYYGMTGAIASIERATVVLGRRALSEIISMASVSVFASREFEGYGLTGEEMWWHSIAVAIGAKTIAEKVRPAMAEEAFAAGLIHDAGKLVLDKFVLENKGAYDALLQDGNVTVAEAEKEILGWDHCEIASQVCASWKVPDHLAEAVRHHHNPLDSPRRVLSSIVHLADGMAHVCGAEAGMKSRPLKMDKQAVRLLDLAPLQMNTIMIRIQESVQQARDSIWE